MRITVCSSLPSATKSSGWPKPRSFLALKAAELPGSFTTHVDLTGVCPLLYDERLV